MKLITITELIIYAIGLVSMLQMHMETAMYLMFAGMILNCLTHLIIPNKKSGA